VILVVLMLLAGFKQERLAGAEHQANNKAESAAAPSRAPLSFLGNKTQKKRKKKEEKESGFLVAGTLLLVGVLGEVVAAVLILLVVVGGGDEDGHAIGMIYVSLLVVVAR
jgi:hypothetical protein